MKIYLIVLFFFLSHTAYIAQICSSEKKCKIDKDKIRKHLEILGSDLFEGRGTGTKGGALAANYIATEFKKIELKPVGEDSTYFQNVPLHGTTVLDNSKLIFFSSLDTLQLSLREDYILANSGEQTIIPSAIGLVFVGFGIIAPEYDHNDYLEKDVTGKIVVMLNGEPESNSNGFFRGDEPTIYSYPDVKHRIAIGRGAAGTIIIPQIRLDDEKAWHHLVNEYSFEDVKLPYTASENFSIILNPNIAKQLFVSGKIHPNSVLNCNLFSTSGCTLEFEGEFFQRDFKAQNVVGVIEAKKNINNEFVIISAHYDHLGIGPTINNDKIYNGVLDNAIGVSTLLEVARVLQKNQENLKRSILFIATTGEEKGLLGSSYYVDHPIVPLYKTVANINIDGAAYLDDFNSVIGIGAELSDLEKYLENTANKSQVKVSEIPKEFYSYEAFNRSDQIAFAKAGIPSLLLLDAPDYANLRYDEAINKIINYDSKIYHTPFDDLSTNINYGATAKHAEIIALLIYNIATSKDKINWEKNVPYNYIRLQTLAEKR